MEKSKYKHKFEIELEVSHPNEKAVKVQLERVIRNWLDNASFMSGKPEKLKSIKLKLNGKDT